MSEHPIRRAVRQLGAAPESDLELLDRWASVRDQSAFELLVWRHGSAVLAACRRLLSEQDAEDAFQATFLVLARKAGSVGRRGTLGGWLHRVAVRASRVAQAQASRRPGPLTAEPATAGSPDADTSELRGVLDEELDRLPERFRRVVVLCYLQGKTAEDAARELGCPRGTVLSRLLRARERLRGRLARRGVGLSVAGVFASLESAARAAIPAEVVRASVSLAADPGSGAGPAVALAQGVLRAMWWNTVKTCTTAALVVAGLGCGVGLAWQRAGAQAQPAPVAQTAVVQPPATPAKVPDEQPDPKNVMEKLNGKWQGVSVEIQGESQGEDTARSNVWEIKDGKITIAISNPKEGTKEQVLPFKIDPTQNPAHIDFEVEIASMKGVQKGIYKLDGDELTVCIHGESGARPIEFRSGTPKGGLFLMKFKREKPAGDKPDPKKELAKLNGKWQGVNQEVDGQTHGEEVARTNVWVIKDGKITSRYFDTNEGAEKVNEWPFKIDPTQNPAHIDVEFDVAGQKRTIMGIYKLDGDELTICLFGAVDERPTEFRNSRKGGNLVIKFKRQKQ